MTAIFGFLPGKHFICYFKTFKKYNFKKNKKSIKYPIYLYKT